MLITAFTANVPSASLVLTMETHILLFYETHCYYYNIFLNFIVAGITIDFCQMGSWNGIRSVLFQEFLKTWSLHYKKECLNTIIFTNIHGKFRHKCIAWLRLTTIWLLKQQCCLTSIANILLIQLLCFIVLQCCTGNCLWSASFTSHNQQNKISVSD